MSNLNEQILQNINKPGSSSKKWVAAMIGLFCVMLIFLATLGTIVFTKGTASGDLVSLSNICVTFIGMLVSILLTGQSMVEWKSMASIQQNNTSQTTTETTTTTEDVTKHETKTENINKHELLEIHQYILEEGEKGAPTIKPYTTQTDEGESK